MATNFNKEDRKMKKTFFSMLPFVAAVVLAVSCGKDGDSDVNINEPEPVAAPSETTVDNDCVVIPFSIKVNDSKSLSKVSLDGATRDINFEPEDVNTVKLSVVGKTDSGISGTLNLSEDVPHVFSGEITVPKAQEKAFNAGIIDLVGTFTQVKGTGTAKYATSFENLWNNCAHTYKAEFKSSGSNGLTLYDQNFYIYVADYKSGITIDGKTVTEGNFTKGNYYVFSYGTKVSGTSKTIAPSKLYTIGKAVTSIKISGGFVSSESNPYVWGSETTNQKTLTAQSDDGVTIKNVIWKSDADNVSVDQKTGTITINAPNTSESTEKITITATAADGSGVKGTYTLYLAKYVQIAGAIWYTRDWCSTGWDNLSNAPAGTTAPTKKQCEDLINNTDKEYYVSSEGLNIGKIKSKNGSNAYITMVVSLSYWTCTPESKDSKKAYRLFFTSTDNLKVDLEDKACEYRVRLVRK